MTFPRLALSLLLLLLLMGGCTQWRAASREEVAEDRYPPEGQIVVVDGQRMHAVVTGLGPDLVLIHGASGSLRDMTFDIAPELAKRYRVIAVDRPGFGWSDPAPNGASLIVQARLIQETAAAVGADKPIVMGHSYGGAVALAWAVDRPETMAALVPVSAPSHLWETGLPFLYQLTAPPLGQALIVPLIAAWTPEERLEREVAAVFAPQTMPEGYAEHFGPEMTLRRDTLRANARQRAGLKSEIARLIPHYPQIDMPVEIVHGAADTIVGLEIHSAKLVKAIPGAHLTSLPGIGHMPQHVAMPQVIAAIDRAAARAGLR